MVCRKVQLHAGAPVVANWEEVIPTGDLERWKALGWEPCERELPAALPKSKTIVEYFNAGAEPPRPQ